MKERASNEPRESLYTDVSPQSPTAVLDLLPPYPIVLVTTRSNVITVNQVAYFTFRPLRIGVAIAHTRFTYGLLSKEGEFVVNVPDASLIEAVKTCGSRSGKAGDKFEAAGLTRMASSRVQAVGIAQCGAQIECRVERRIGFERRDWFIGEVVAAWTTAQHASDRAMMCGRHHYLLPGEIVSMR
jgi:flavin reductase (DIM6/NTAB) family NADH-FMN oxidoreductase RutF